MRQGKISGVLSGDSKTNNVNGNGQGIEPEQKMRKVNVFPRDKCVN